MRKIVPLLSGVLAVLFIAGCPTSSTGSSDKELTKFSFLAITNPALISTDVAGTVNGQAIALEVPYGTDVTALTASFSTSTGARVAIAGAAQTSGITPNNFSNPVTYTVTAEDGSTQDYTVTVTIAKNSAEEFTAFRFTSAANTALTTDVTGTITGKAIALTVPFGTNVTALVPDFTTTGKSVTIAGTPQISGTTSNDFSNPVTYTVTAEDGSTQDYTVTVTITKNSAKKFTDFRFLAANTALTTDVTGTITEKAIALTVPFGTNVTALVPDFTTTGKSVTIAGTPQISGTTPNDFSTPVTYTVTAEDGSTQDYTVTVTMSPKNAKEFTDFRFLAANTALTTDVTGTITGKAIALTVPFGTNVTALVPDFTTTGKSVTIAGTAQTSGTTPNDFSNPVTYTVTAEDGSTQDYTVTVTITKNSAKELTRFRFTSAANTALTTDVTGTITGKAIALTVPRGTNVTALVPDFTTTGKSVTIAGTPQISGTTSNDFSNPVTYTVTAEDESTQDYTVTVTITKNSAKEFTTFRFPTTANTALNKDVTGIISKQLVALTVPFGTNITALVPDFTTTGKSVTIAGTPQISGTTSNDFSNPLTYTVTAEDGSTHDYTVLVTIALGAVLESLKLLPTTPPNQLGDLGLVFLRTSSKSQNMIYANDQASRTLPTGVDDTGVATLTHPFWIGETEITNALFAAVYQWAYENKKFSATAGSPNFLDATTAKHGGQQLVDLDAKGCKVDYSVTNGFSVQSGKEKLPVIFVNWYGTIMFCNWLTEMRDANTDNVVYSGIDSDWLDTETIEDRNRNGYRLPTSNEWEYAARYGGTTDTTNTVSGYTTLLYTKGDSASGATANDTVATGMVAVYNQKTGESSVKTKKANALGLYDMSGNVKEWCYAKTDSTSRVARGGAWNDKNTNDMRTGIVSNSYPNFFDYNLGFRLCRTAD